MKERHLFKAKRIKDGQWVEGAFYIEPYTDRCYIIQWNSTGLGLNEFIEVDGETICQCTGLEDRNGRLIFENDIVKDLFSDTAAPIRYGSYQSCFDSTKVEHVGFYVDWSGKYNKNYRKDLGYWIHMVDAELIGNTFDNPELLEV